MTWKSVVNKTFVNGSICCSASNTNAIPNFAYGTASRNKNTILNRPLRKADPVVAVSAWLKDWLEQEVGCARVTHIPNAVTPLEGNPVRGREWLGLKGDRPIVGFVGSMKPWHGIGFLSELASDLNAHVVAIGHGSVPHIS